MTNSRRATTCTRCTLEDCRHRNQSAKVEENQSYIFVVLKSVAKREDGSLDLSDLDLFIGTDFLITVEEGCDEQVGRTIDQVKAAAGEMRPTRSSTGSPTRWWTAICPSSISSTTSSIPWKTRSCETRCRRPAAHLRNQARADRIAAVLVNMRDVSAHLQRTESPLIGRDLWPFLRDVYDHLARNIDMVEMQRDLLTGSLDIYLSSVANRTNQVMKVLTVLGTIALPALVVSSIFGMNLKGLPWLESPTEAGWRS